MRHEQGVRTPLTPAAQLDGANANMLRTPARTIFGLLAALLLGARAGAADLYLSGTLGNSGGFGSSSGKTDFFDIDGDDSDASPSYGGSFGLSFAMDEAVPSIRSFELPSWTVRMELEFLTGRDYELRSDGATGQDDFFTEVDAWTLLPSVWVDLPLRTPISWLFGRVPVLEPMSLYGGGGIGLASVDLYTRDQAFIGKTDSLNFAWQAGLGLAYELTDTTTFSVGWRYLSMGETEADLLLAPGVKGGKFTLDMSSHEILTGLRVNFYTSPLGDMHPRHWRAPRVLTGWKLPRWLGGGADESAGDEGDL
jgi:hypothetical protein